MAQTIHSGSSMAAKSVAVLAKTGVAQAIPNGSPMRATPCRGSATGAHTEAPAGQQGKAEEMLADDATTCRGRTAAGARPGACQARGRVATGGGGTDPSWGGGVPGRT